MVELSKDTQEIDFSSWRPIAYHTEEAEAHLSVDKQLFKYKNGTLQRKAYGEASLLVAVVAEFCVQYSVAWYNF